MYITHEAYILRVEDGACIPLDTDNVDYLAYLAWLDEGNVQILPAAPSIEERAAALLLAVDAHLNAAARAKGYDSITNAALRAALPDSPFHAEGLAFGHWMDAVYAKCYDVLAGVQAGEIPEPNRDQLIDMLPVLVLPT